MERNKEILTIYYLFLDLKRGEMFPHTDEEIQVILNNLKKEGCKILDHKRDHKIGLYVTVERNVK
jgi:hypothetical protein